MITDVHTDRINKSETRGETRSAYTSKHEHLNQCWLVNAVGPPSQMVDQHLSQHWFKVSCSPGHGSAEIYARELISSAITGSRANYANSAADRKQSMSSIHKCNNNPDGYKRRVRAWFIERAPHLRKDRQSRQEKFNKAQKTAGLGQLL